MKKQLIATIVAGAISLTSLTALAGCGGSGENTAPVIEGVKDTVTVEAGTQFNALSGVTATDKEDGDLTSKIVVESLPALTFTDGKATPSQSGTYELTYSVTDSGKLTAEEYSTLIVTRHAAEATSLIKFNFDNTTQPEAHGWASSIGESATATAALKEGAYVFDITNAGENDQAVALIKTVTLEAADYKLKVWAKSTKDTYAHVLADGAEGGMAWNARIGSAVQAVEASFSVSEEKSVDLRVNLGKITPNPDNAADTTPEDFTVTIDKIELYKITGTETQTALKSYDFENDITGLTVSADAAYNVTAVNENGAAQITIGSYPEETGDDWRIKAAFALPDITIEAETKYYYSFKITAQNAVSDMIVCAEDNVREWENRACYQSYSLAEGESRTISGTFIPGGDMKSDITDAVLRLYLGKHADTVTNNVLTIDDVVFGKLEGDKKTEKTIDRFMAYGKDSQNETNTNYLWDTFNGTDEDNEKGVGTIWTEGGSLFYRIDEGSTTDWHNKLFFGYTANPLTLPSDSYFTIRFTAKATKAVSCPMFLNVLGNWAPRVTQTVNFTTEYQEFEFVTTETLVMDMNFELLFQFGSAALAELGEVTIEFKDFEILQSVVS